MPQLPALAFIGQPSQSDPNAFGRAFKIADLLKSRQLTPDALGGDAQSFGQLAGINPQAAESVQNILSSQAKTTQDSATAAQAKRLEGVRLTKRILDVVAAASPEAQPELYRAGLQRLQQFGVDVGETPPDFDAGFVEQQRGLLQAFQDEGGFELVDDPEVLKRFQKGTVLQQDTRSGERSILQKPPASDTGVTLSPGQTRFDSQGNPVASLPAKPVKDTGFTLKAGDQRFNAAGEPIASRPNEITSPKITDVASARKEFSSLSKNFILAREGLEKVRQAAKGDSGQNDVALIFGFMKTIDPASTVREGEFATAEQTGGIPDRISNLYNRALSGERLTQSQRDGFVEAAESQFLPLLEQQLERERNFTAIATRQGFDPRNIVTDFLGPLRPDDLTPEEQAELEELRRIQGAQ